VQADFSVPVRLQRPSSRNDTRCRPFGEAACNSESHQVYALMLLCSFSLSFVTIPAITIRHVGSLLNFVQSRTIGYAGHTLDDWKVR